MNLIYNLKVLNIFSLLVQNFITEYYSREVERELCLIQRKCEGNLLYSNLIVFLSVKTKDWHFVKLQIFPTVIIDNSIFIQIFLVLGTRMLK